VCAGITEPRCATSSAHRSHLSTLSAMLESRVVVTARVRISPAHVRGVRDGRLERLPQGFLKQETLGNRSPLAGPADLGNSDDMGVFDLGGATRPWTPTRGSWGIAACHARQNADSESRLAHGGIKAWAETKADQWRADYVASGTCSPRVLPAQSAATRQVADGVSGGCAGGRARPHGQAATRATSAAVQQRRRHSHGCGGVAQWHTSLACGGTREGINDLEQKKSPGPAIRGQRCCWSGALLKPVSVLPDGAPSGARLCLPLAGLTTEDSQ